MGLKKTCFFCFASLVKSYPPAHVAAGHFDEAGQELPSCTRRSTSHWRGGSRVTLMHTSQHVTLRRQVKIYPHAHVAARHTDEAGQELQSCTRRSTSLWRGGSRVTLMYTSQHVTLTRRVNLQPDKCWHLQPDKCSAGGNYSQSSAPQEAFTAG